MSGQPPMPPEPWPTSQGGMAQLGTLAVWLRCGRITSEELTTGCLRRIEAGRSVNAVVELDTEQAIASAREADRRLRTGATDAGPLCGIPVTVKRTFEVQGFTHLPPDVEPGAPCGIPASHDAAMVELLRSAGMVVLGRTNAPARAADIDTWHPRYGRTTHPLDASLSPGGSSGGSAAAVAAGHTAFDVGSDDAGSARIPAHICGVFALRPTLGRLSPLGHVPGPLTEFDHSSSMLTVAPIARSAEDLSLIWRVLGPPAGPPRPPAGRPVAVVLEDAGAPVSRQVTQSLHDAVDGLRRAGHEIVAARLPVDLAENWLLCQQLLYAEDGGAGDGGAGDGKTEAGPDRTGSAAPAAGAAPIDVAWWCAGLSHRAWCLLNRKRAESQMRWQRFFDRYSALLIPVMGVATLPPRDMAVPFVVDEVAIDGVEIPVFSLSAWCALASVAGLPAVSMPVASAGGGFPVGLQVIAGHGQEAALLELTERFATELSPAPALREHP